MTKRKIINAPVVIIALVAALLIVFLKISLTSTPMLQGDYPYYPDVQSITDSADVIIVGEVVTLGMCRISWLTELLVRKIRNLYNIPLYSRGNRGYIWRRSGWRYSHCKTNWRL